MITSDNSSAKSFTASHADIGGIALALPIPTLLRPAPLRKRLWQGAGAIAVFLATLLAGNLIVERDRAVTRGMLGHDFLAFYTAGTFARTGKLDQLYNLQSVKGFEQQVASANNLEVRDAVGPFWNPPFYAWLFAPLSLLGFPAALKVWIALNLMALGAAIVLLCRLLPSGADRSTMILVPVLVLVSMPFLQAITHAQNSFISLLLLTGVVTLWRRHRDVTAGMLCGLLFYKPQLALVIAIMLVLDRGLRVCLGLAFVLGSLCLLTAFSMPNSIGDYLHRLPLNVQFMQMDNAYMWERHVTLKGFWRLLIQGREAGDTAMIVRWLTVVSCVGLVAGLLVAISRNRRAAIDDIWTGETRSIRRDRLITATIACMPLLMPFYFDYDLLLLGIPAVLFAGEMLVRAPGQPIDGKDKLLLGTWIALYVWLMINPGIGRSSGINLTVILLTTIAALLIRRACRTVEPQQFGLRAPEVIRVSARRAA